MDLRRTNWDVKLPLCTETRFVECDSKTYRIYEGINILHKSF